MNRHRHALLAITAMVMSLTACATHPVRPAPAEGMSTTAVVAPASAHCTVVSGKADHVCTPGATNSLVAKDGSNIRTTICASKVSGADKTWTQQQRPPTNYTNTLKKTQMREYGETGQLGGFEEDHLIPLALGGAPRDPHNLWPEPWNGPTGAHRKDDDELTYWHAVCAVPQRMTLAAAQDLIVTNWTH